VDIACIVIVMIFPILATFAPRLMGGAP
jgi:hypothetical protein